MDKLQRKLIHFLGGFTISDWEEMENSYKRAIQSRDLLLTSQKELINQQRKQINALKRSIKR